MSLGLMMTIFAIIIKLIDIVYKKFQKHHLNRGSIVEEQTITLTKQQINDTEKEVIQKIDEYQPEASQQYRQHYRPERNDDKTIVKQTNSSANMISDNTSPIFTAKDLSEQQLVKNIIFSEVMSKPKAKR